MCFFFYFSEADDVKLLLHSPEKVDIGDGGGDPSVVLLPLEHAVNGDSLGPSAATVAAPFPVNNNPPDDDDDNG